MDLTTATPVEIDTVIAEIYTRYYKALGLLQATEKHIKDMRSGLEKHLSGKFGGRYSSYTQEALDRLIEKARAQTATARDILAESYPLEREFTRRGGWSRFFLVQNNGGHIHNSMGCSTCFPTTQFGWLPEVSGATEAEAVEGYGCILCTVCFPSAPTEWSSGKKPGDEDVCAGSGSYLRSDLPHRSGYVYGNWATCPECTAKPALTKAYRLRKHKREA